MRQELSYGEFTLVISTSVVNEVFSSSDKLLFELSMNDQFQTSIHVTTPIESIDQLQKEFDKVAVCLGIEFCKVDRLQQYYDYFAPHVKEILSNYCIRINSDEDIKDVNPLYIRSKFLENA